MKLTKALIGISIAGLLLSGCGNNQAPQTGTPGTDNQVKTILVGTEGTYSPFTFQDDKGNITGYDIDVVKEIDKRIDELEFQFVPTPWDSMFLGLESKKYDMVANQIAKRPDREEKYDFTQNSYFVSASQIIVRSDDSRAINGLEDLAGLKVGTSVGSNYTAVLEEYNSKNGDALDLQYYDGNITTVLQDLVAKRIDATVNDRTIAADNIQKLGLGIKLVGEPTDTVPTYFVFRKDQESAEIRKKIDAALAEIIADGTLKEISVKWFGEDFTK